MLNEWCATSDAPEPAIISTTAANTARRVFMTCLHITARSALYYFVTGYKHRHVRSVGDHRRVWSSRQRVREKGIVGREQEKLASIQHVCNRRVRHVAQHGISTIG